MSEETNDMENRPLWSDSNPYDPMTCEMYEEARAMFYLYEDIQCLKEDIQEQQKMIKSFLDNKDIIIRGSGKKAIEDIEALEDMAGLNWKAHKGK